LLLLDEVVDHRSTKDAFTHADAFTNTSNGTECWTQSSDKYIEESVKTVQEFLRSKNRVLPTRLRTPMRSDYKPEFDTSPKLVAEGHSYYQELISILRWAVELGRMDILLEVSLMSTYLAAPREGHLEQVFHIFGYLFLLATASLAFCKTEATVSIGQTFQKPASNV
jgi:hypothetical protein